jgi:hypothetical protein
VSLRGAERRSNLGRPYGYAELVLKPLPSPGGKWSMEDVNSLYLSNMIIIDIKKDNLFLYLHFSEKGIYSAVNQRMTTEKEQGRPEDRASG